MKKLLFIGLASVLLSCKAFYGYEPTFTMGMNETEFKTKNKVELVSASQENGENIYRSYNPLTQYKFFFFKKEKLVRYERGQNPDDYQFIRF